MTETAKIKNENARWYVAYVHSGCEKAVLDRLNEKIKKLKQDALFNEILIPSHEITELKNGKKVKVEKKLFPGYILINMVMNNDTWHTVKDIPLVSGFLGSHSKPSPVSEREAQALIHRLDNSAGEETFVSDVSYDVGEAVRVNEGPFASFNGVIERVDAEKQRVLVSVSIFGRPTQVELSFFQVEKI
ncbi:MAG: transcription termination/antitermination protein NusG [Alphaproteobacteria bacterium]|nr:transcription termination/antitermination protein NusG [Alphaproteobacteria bacterium]